MFLQDQNGNVAIVGALSATALLFAAGAAIDYNNLLRARTDLQAALDSATLASAASKNAFDKKDALEFFGANADMEKIEIISLKFSKGADDATVGHLEATLQNSFMSLAGLAVSKINLDSSAIPVTKAKLSKATFQITNAQGAYDKDIYFFTKDADGKVLTETLVLQYDYDNSGGAGEKTFTPKMTNSVTIKVEDYETYGQRMVVYEDTSYLGKHINPKSYSSDDKSASTWTKVAGNCDDKSGQVQNWEDGGDKNYLDFVFNMSCDVDTVATGEVRLVK